MYRLRTGFKQKLYFCLSYAWQFSLRLVSEKKRLQDQAQYRNGGGLSDLSGLDPEVVFVDQTLLS